MNMTLPDGRHESERGLLEPDDFEKEVNTDDQPAVVRDQPMQFRSLGVWSLVITIACSLLNFFLWVDNSRGSALSRTSLERPSTYIGLVDVPHNMSEESLLHFATYPAILTQISQAEPDRVYPDDTKQELRVVGTISPDSRRFSVSSKVSSVAQFRAIDYGFEFCSLRFNMEGPLEKGFIIDSEPVSIRIWILDEPSRIDVRQLSWSTRPPRKRLLDTVRLTYGSVQTTEPVHCAWGSFPTFEFSCEQGDCLLDFWQDPKVSDLGVTMVQHSSLG